MASLTTCNQCGTEVSRRANSCPNCGAVLRETLPPQTTDPWDVFVLPAGIVMGLFTAVLLSKLPGNAGDPVLRVGLGVVGLVLPSALALAWTSRRRKVALVNSETVNSATVNPATASPEDTQ